MKVPFIVDVAFCYFYHTNVAHMLFCGEAEDWQLSRTISSHEQDHRQHWAGILFVGPRDLNLITGNGGF